MKILLHSCCAPCGGQVISELQKEGHEVVVYFYNPNIWPEHEYNLRLAEVKRFTDEQAVKLIEGNFAHSEWLQAIKGFEHEPEKGERCRKCFMHRLGEVAQKAMEEGFDAFASTLTISPHKPAEMINEIGAELAEFYNIKFLDNIWRKNDGYKKSCEISKEHDFHRQDYCGCEFSKPSE